MRPNLPTKVVRFAVSPKSLDSLPSDVLVDHLLGYLGVEDVLRLRQTNRFFNALTRHTVIWKRFLQATCDIVPPFISSRAEDSDEKNDLERAVTTAYALDKAWRSPSPVLHEWKFNAHSTVENIFLLPGSEYLVASVSTEAHAPEDMHYAVILYALDGKATTVVTPIALFSTDSKAHHLTARFLSVDGVAGISVTFVTVLGSKCTDNSDRVDAKVKHSCYAIHVSLSDARHVQQNMNLVGSTPDGLIKQLRNMPSLFNIYGRIDSLATLGSPSVDVFPSLESPSVVLSVPQVPNRLLCRRLDRRGNYTFQIQFSDPGAPRTPADVHQRQSTRAVKLLPGVDKILVVRHDTRVLNVEWHDLPPEVLANIAPSDKLPEIIPTRSSFRKYYIGPDVFHDVDIILSPAPPDTISRDVLGTIHVYAHVSNTPTSPHRSILHLSFPPQPGHTHHFDESDRPHHTTRTSPLPNPLPLPIILGGSEWVGPGGVVYVASDHYCSAGMKKEWVNGAGDDAWRLVKSCAGKDGLGRIFRIRHQNPAVVSVQRAPCHKTLERVDVGCVGSKISVVPIHTPTPVQDVAWDDTIGRLCWTCKGQSKVYVADLLSKRIRLAD